MKFDRLVEICAGLHCFSPGMLGAGEDMDRLRVQLSRWVRARKLIRIHKGWYTLANAYRRINIDNFVVACVTNAGSYVSMQSALSHHGMIPEHVPETTCVTTGRPKVIDCPFGRLSYRHLKQGAFWGFEATADSTAGQHAWMARPEKALLDLVYLSPGGVDMGFIAGLRLQNLGALDLGTLAAMAVRFGQPNLARVADMVAGLMSADAETAP